ncbi:hypothetical protein TNCV_3392941 [Trichonephila clavipes]|nr:hypothetical protein TNCV_3392941 [Trichonephila clavipes]
MKLPGIWRILKVINQTGVFSLTPVPENFLTAELFQGGDKRLIVRVQYFVRGGFVGHRYRASSKHLSPHFPVDELDSSGDKKGLRCSCKMHVWVSGPQRSRLDVDVSKK